MGKKAKVEVPYLHGKNHAWCRIWLYQPQSLDFPQAIVVSPMKYLLACMPSNMFRYPISELKLGRHNHLVRHTSTNSIEARFFNIGRPPRSAVPGVILLGGSIGGVYDQQAAVIPDVSDTEVSFGGVDQADVDKEYQDMMDLWISPVTKGQARTKPKYSLEGDEEQEIRAMLASGFSVQEVSKKYGLLQRVVAKYAK